MTQVLHSVIKTILCCLLFCLFSFAEAEVVTYYDIYRNTVNSSANLTPHKTVTSFYCVDDEDIVAGESYFYWVRVREAETLVAEDAVVSYGFGDSWRIRLIVPTKVVKNEDFPVYVSAKKTEDGLSPIGSVTLELVEDSGWAWWDTEVIKSVTASGDLSERWVFSVDQGDGLDGQIETFLRAKSDDSTFVQTGMIYTDVTDSYDAGPQNFSGRVVSGSVSLSWDPAVGNSGFETPVSVTIPNQDDSGTDVDGEIFNPVADTRLDESSEDSVYGSSGYLWVSGIADARIYSLLQFDISSIPEGSTINSVELKMYASSIQNPTDTKTYLVTVSESWDENSATWANQPSVAEGVWVGTQTLSFPGWHSWSDSDYSALKEVVQVWIDNPSDNHGFLLFREPGTPGTTLYFSREGSAEQRPKLIIDYTLPPIDVPDPDVSKGTYTDRVVLNWEPVDRASQYRVRRAESVGGENEYSWLVGFPAKTDVTALSGKRYYYSVSALNANEESAASDLDIGYAKLAEPSGTEALGDVHSGRIRITWNSVPGALTYQVYRAESLMGEKTLVGSVASESTAFNDFPSDPDKIYYYWVTAKYDYESNFSSSAAGQRRDSISFDASPYSGGDGSLDNPYLISTQEDLLEMAVDTNSYDKCFIMTADVDLSDVNCSKALIAPDLDDVTEFHQGAVFSGRFDGAGFFIRNLTIDTSSASNDYLGLFGLLMNAEISNLHLEGVDIRGGVNSDYIGGLCGEILFQFSSVNRCSVSGSVRGGEESQFVGGLCGRNFSGTISQCFAEGEFYGDLCAGGLCGYNEYGTIVDSYSSSSIEKASSSRNIGGFCGLNAYDGASILRCYSSGAVSSGFGSNNIGGFCGGNAGQISSCFWDMESSGLSTSAGGTGKTTIQMKTLSTFSDVGWDFSTLWQMDGYPVLKPLFFLSVEGGDGDGYYTAGSSVSVSAEPMTAGKVFSGWSVLPSEYAENFADPAAESTSFYMPSENTVLTAGYDAIISYAGLHLRSYDETGDAAMDGAELSAFLGGTDLSLVSNAVLTTPLEEQFSFSEDNSEWHVNVDLEVSLGAFDDRFPEGDYWIDVTYADSSTYRFVVQAPSVAELPYPQQIPVISVDEMNTKGYVDPSQDIHLSWDLWEDALSSGSSVQLWIDEIGGYYLASSATNFTVSSNSMPEEGGRLNIWCEFRNETGTVNQNGTWISFDRGAGGECRCYTTDCGQLFPDYVVETWGILDAQPVYVPGDCINAEYSFGISDGSENVGVIPFTILLSRDNQVDESDYVFIEAEAGASWIEGSTETSDGPVFTVPGGLSSGEYYAGIVLDPDELFNDPNRSNNLKWAADTVIIADPLIPTEWIQISNPGNDCDQNGAGSVAYEYSIGKYEVSISQYVEAYNQDDSLGDGDELYWADLLGSNAPVACLSWYEAARYCNWLTSGSSSNGAYEVDVGGMVVGINRSAALELYNPVYVLPTRDEWYKAAYYSEEGFSAYANGFDYPPLAFSEANYDPSDSAWVVFQGAEEQNGTVNMMGNVGEWSESFGGLNDDLPLFLGGDYTRDYLAFSKTRKATAVATREAVSGGIRLVRLVRDADQDGLADWWEVAHYGDVNQAVFTALCSNSVNSVFEAYVAGLNPNDPEARFDAGIENQVLQWDTVPGRVYDVYCTTNLLSGFQCVASNIPWAENHFTNTSESPCEYYKIDVRLEE